MNLDAVIQLHRTGDLVGAESGYRTLLMQRRKDVDLYNNLALICLNTGRVDEGIALLRTSINLNPNNPEAHLNLGVALQQHRTFEAAIACYHEALKLNPAYPEPYNNLGNVYADQGKLDKAAESYSMAVSLRPEFVEAHYNLGNTLRSMGRLDDAVASYKKVIELKPVYLLAHLNLGNVFQDLARWDEAIACYQRIIDIDPNNFNAYNNMGNALRGKGCLVDAIAAFAKSIELNEHQAHAHFNLGVALVDCGRLDDAVASYRRSLAINPAQPNGHFNLGVVLAAQGRLDEALTCYFNELRYNPNHADAHNNVGIIYCEQGKLEEGIAAFSRAVAARPNYAEAYYNIGNTYRGLMRQDEAIAAYLKAVDLKPYYPIAYLNMGNACQEINQFEAAAEAYQQAIDLAPDFPEAHNNLGTALRELGKFEEALVSYDRALSLRPTYDQAYYNQALSLQELGRLDDAVDAFQNGLESVVSTRNLSTHLQQLGKNLIDLERLPIIYGDESEVASRRRHFKDCLEKALALSESNEHKLTNEERSVLRQMLFRINNFYLVYQQQDDLELQVAYVKLAMNILREEVGQFLKLDRVGGVPAKIKIGVASEYLKKHNGASWSYGWFANLPADDYEFFFYAINGRGLDELSQKFANLGTFRVLPFRENDYLRSLETIKQDNLDVLLLPDVGMTGSSKILSLLRLAPVQCVGWGHPVTSGSSNMDFYLSSEFMEPSDGDKHYSEKLVRLPKIGVNLDYPDMPAQTASRADFDIPKTKVVYGAVQSLFKYLPQHDFVYPEIAKNVPNALFLFVGNNSASATDAFRQRLEKAFDKEGLSFKKHVRILPRMSFPNFMQLLTMIDVYLDSIGFSGGITAARALAAHCPIVTLPGEFMRSRLANAMMRMIEVDELSASSLNDYISIASRLGKDKKLRASIADKIQNNKHKLFGDRTCVEYLDRFLKSQVEMARRS